MNVKYETSPQKWHRPSRCFLRSPKQIQYVCVFVCQKGYVMGIIILLIFGPDYPKMSDRQLKSFRTLSLNNKRKERYNHNSQRENKPRPLTELSTFLKTRGNNLKSLASIFQVVIHFHPGHLQPKTLVSSFTALIQLHVLIISILAICSQRHLLTASLHLYSYMYYSFPSWPSAAKDTC